jgi:predicted TIM-barrel fold metal-dependent hydrolase
LLEWGIDVLGAERVLFGSDYPYCNMGKYKEKILSLLHGRSPEDIEKIMGGNAQRLLEG